MSETKLQLVNSTLALLGEHALIGTNNTLGNLVVTALNSALVKVVQETRANVFERVLAANVTNQDYLVPSLTIPDDTIQVFSVLLRISTGSSSGDKLVPLEYSSLEELQEAPRYSVVGRELFVSPMLARPFTLRCHLLTLPQLPANDNDDSGIPDIVLPAVRHTAAVILYSSYLDDPNGAAIQRALATELIDKLRNQYGNFRAKSFNMSKALGNGFTFGGFSSVTSGLAYAPVDSPTFTGDPKAPTPATADNDTSIATTAYVKANLVNYLTTAAATATYLTQADAASTYLTISNASSTYLTQANAASTYLTQTNAASTYAPLASPALTGTPTAPTPSSSNNSTQIATTAFVRLTNRPAAQMIRNASGTPTTTDFLVVPMTAVIFDSNGIANLGSNLLTIPTGFSGYYLMSGHSQIVNLDGSNTRYLGFDYQVNSAYVFANQQILAPTNGMSNAFVSQLVFLNAGDTIRVVSRNYGSGSSYRVDFCNLQLFRLNIS